MATFANILIKKAANKLEKIEGPWTIFKGQTDMFVDSPWTVHQQDGFGRGVKEADWPFSPNVGK